MATTDPHSLPVQRRVDDNRFYTQCFRNGSNIYIQGYLNGKRWRHVVKPYSPTLYVKAKDSESAPYRVLGTNEGLQPKRFPCINDAVDYIGQYKDFPALCAYGSTDWVGEYLYALFPDAVHYDTNLIRVAFIDIEVNTEGGFSSVDDAWQPIISITVGFRGKHYVFGLVDFTVPEGRTDIYYKKCKNESDLLGVFLRLWKTIDPDVVSGYNVSNYDLPYIAKRLGDSDVHLSPWKMKPQFIEGMNRRGRVLRPVIHGVSCLDYYDLYTNGKFVQGEREEYTLDYISHYELGSNKVDYSEYGTLAKLYERNPQKFIEYNIHDVELVEQLDEKLGFMDLVYVMAYDARVNYADTLGTVRIWENLARNHLLDKHIVSPLKAEAVDDDGPSIQGGYVKNPKPGLYKWVVSFDASSLYPSLIRQLNISPETLVGMEYSLHNVTIGSSDWAANLDKAVKNDWTVASNGAAFKKSEVGFLPELMAKYYKRKKDASTLLIEQEKENENTPSAALQHQIGLTKSRIFATKILLNSLFGATANKYFQYYDKHIAEAITMSGQTLIKYTADRVNIWMSKVLGHDDDYIIASDTDSVMVDCSRLVCAAQRKGLLASNANTHDIVVWLDKVCDKVLNPVFAEIMNDVTKQQNALENVVKMVREGISDAALWTAAKNYVMRVRNNKGVMFSKPKYKIKGLGAIKSSTPSKCRDKLKDAIPYILDEDQKGLSAFVSDFSDEYPNLPLSEVSKNISLRYSEKVVTQQMRAAEAYNMMLQETKLTDKYGLLEPGSKMRIVKLKTPNPTGSAIIGFPNGVLPPEFQLDKYIDYDAMFDQYFMSSLNIMAGAAGLSVSTQPTLLDFSVT